MVEVVKIMEEILIQEETQIVQEVVIGVDKIYE
jgi:hypothetical protein